MGTIGRHCIIQRARAVRAFLEDEWTVWHRARGRSLPMPLSSGTCQTSSLFLTEVFRNEGIKAVVRQGSDVARSEGYFFAGKWHGHAWVELSGYLVDVTGDQFDLPEVHVEEIGSDRYRAGSDTACHAAKVIRTELVTASLEEWKLRGLKKLKEQYT